MKTASLTAMVLAWALLCSPALAVETGNFRLLSISESSKLMLLSRIPDKVKYVMDATTAKITVDGEPIEFSELKAYSVVHVKYQLRKIEQDGIEVDGAVMEVLVETPDRDESAP